MFSSISWGSYWTVLVILLVIYYGYVLWVNRGDWFTRRLTMAGDGLKPASSDDELFPHADACSRELDAYFQQASHARPIKAEVLFALRQILQKYPALTGSGYQDALSKVIEFSSRDQCAVHLTQDDVRQVWLV